MPSKNINETRQTKSLFNKEDSAIFNNALMGRDDEKEFASISVSDPKKEHGLFRLL